MFGKCPLKSKPANTQPHSLKAISFFKPGCQNGCPPPAAELGIPSWSYLRETTKHKKTKTRSWTNPLDCLPLSRFKDAHRAGLNCDWDMGMELLDWDSMIQIVSPSWGIRQRWPQGAWGEPLLQAETLKHVSRRNMKHLKHVVEASTVLQYQCPEMSRSSPGKTGSLEWSLQLEAFLASGALFSNGAVAWFTCLFGRANLAQVEFVVPCLICGTLFWVRFKWFCSLLGHIMCHLTWAKPSAIWSEALGLPPGFEEATRHINEFQLLNFPTIWTLLGPPSSAQGPNLGVYSSKSSSAPRHTAGQHLKVAVIREIKV